MFGRARFPKNIHFGMYTKKSTGIDVSIVSFGNDGTFVEQHSTQSKRFWTFKGFGMGEIEHRSPHFGYTHLFSARVTSQPTLTPKTLPALWFGESHSTVNRFHRRSVCDGSVGINTRA